MSAMAILIKFDEAQRPEFLFNADTEQDMAWLERWIEENLNGGRPKGHSPGPAPGGPAPSLAGGSDGEPTS